MIVMMVLGAFLWRLRGGLLNDLTGQANYRILGVPFNDTVVRAIWAVGMTLAFWRVHPDAHWLGEKLISVHTVAAGVGGVLMGASLFFCSTIGWFGADITPAETDFRDIFRLSLDGFARMFVISIWFMSWQALIAGLLFGPAYWLGARIPRWRFWMFWGEIICGAVIGACLALT